MSGLFVCLEGIDASGKTSTSARIIHLLKERGINAIQLEKKQTDYPTTYLSNFMLNLTELLWNSQDNDPVTEIPDVGWLYMHALWYKIMAEHLIYPALENYEVVLIDSWYYKILSRFLLKPDFDYDLANKVFEDLPSGEHVILLDVSPEICWSRRQSFKTSEMGGHEFFKGSPHLRFINYQSRVREQLLKTASENNNWVVINSEKLDLDQTADEVVELLVNLFNPAR